jgi:hypothetical protein
VTKTPIIQRLSPTPAKTFAGSAADKLPTNRTAVRSGSPAGAIEIPFLHGHGRHAPGNSSELFDVPRQERAMDTDPMDLIDLGDATQETKQLMAIPVYLDSQYFLGLLPDLG